jgi:BirA family biotin operon repressor/biotin-[acetyl-CoA-carboxylase] ligase
MDWVRKDPLDADRIRDLLPTTAIGREIEVHRVLASTNDRVRVRARTGAESGLVVLAEEQTHGRGSGGRRWISAPGEGLWMSVLLRPGDVAPGVVTLGAGVGVRRGIRSHAGVEVALQWPNDLVIQGAKLCGILAETGAERAIALGIGVNVHGAPDAATIGRRAVFLDELAGRRIERNALAAGILSGIADVVAEMTAGRGERLLTAWRRGSNHLGARVQITMGEEVVAGVALDIDPTGALLLADTSGRVRTFVSGSLELAPGGPAG